MDRSFPAPETPSPVVPSAPPDLDELRAEAAARDEAQAWYELAVALTQWGPEDALDDALAAARRADELGATAETRFASGVVHRRRYDSPLRRDGDLAAAVEYWAGALERDLNNYIYRRRIQQYGPRLAKPYPFYDWIARARGDIEARGGSPVDLVAEPGGAELAAPAPEFHTSVASADPDPDGRIARDDTLIDAEWAVVPSAITPGESARVHVVFRPGPEAHWNNEADDMELWISTPDGWETDVRRLTVPNPPEEISSEARPVEFEVRAPVDAAAGTYPVGGYSLYYVCEESDGTCLYQRQDLVISVEVTTEASRGLSDRTR